LRFLNVKINEQSNNPSAISTAHPEAQRAEGSKAFPININTANLTDLEKIPGIGPAIANRIIEYRKTYGNFSSLDDLRKVKGIGDKKLKMMKNCIVLDNK